MSTKPDERVVAVSKRNLADADYEPTDEDLIELSREAFSGVREANDRALRQLRERIAKRSEEVLADLERRLQGDRGTA